MKLISYRSHTNEVEQITLCTNNDLKKLNHYSVIIGSNGAGKSTLLRNIISTIRNDSIGIEINGELKRILAISTGISDKYPLPKELFSTRLESLDNTLRKKNRPADQALEYEYIYIGTKTGETTSNSNKIHERIFEQLSNLGTNSASISVMAKAFEASGFRKEMHLKIKINQTFLMNALTSDKNISRNDLISILKTSKNKKATDRIIKILKNEWILNSLVDFINNKVIHFIPEVNNGLSYQIEFKPNGNALEFIRDQLPLLVLLRDLKVLEFDKVEVAKKDKFPQSFNIMEAGSGELKRFLILFSVAALATDNSLILIDEPEISMHPQWQSDFLIILKEILSNYKGCHTIIATHSPYLISNLKDEDSTIIIFKRNHVETISGATFGWSIEKILLDIFNVATVRNDYFQKDIATLMTSLDPRNKMNELEIANIKEIVIRTEKYINDKRDPLFLLIKKVRENFKETTN